MKKVFNRRLRRRVNAGEFDEFVLSDSDYRKVYETYDISEGAFRQPFLKAIQPHVKLEKLVKFYTLSGFDERGIPILGKVEERLGFVSYKINTKSFDHPTFNTRKNPYSKESLAFERFENWMKEVIRK